MTRKFLDPLLPLLPVFSECSKSVNFFSKITLATHKQNMFLIKAIGIGFARCILLVMTYKYTVLYNSYVLLKTSYIRGVTLNSKIIFFRL